MSKTLRIMPLGGSITYGQGSSDGNGYRDYLRQMLISDGYNVDMVGSRKAGLMQNNNTEGWRGFRIEQIMQKAKRFVPVYRPNIVLINAGSNDCLDDYEIHKAGERIDDILAYLWTVNPESTVILSTLLANKDKATESRITLVNEQLRLLKERRSNEEPHMRLILVDMQCNDGPLKSELVDGTHPNNEGYQKMAKIWYKGFNEAVSKGYTGDDN